MVIIIAKFSNFHEERGILVSMVGEVHKIFGLVGGGILLSPHKGKEHWLGFSNSIPYRKSKKCQGFICFNATWFFGDLTKFGIFLRILEILGILLGFFWRFSDFWIFQLFYALKVSEICQILIIIPEIFVIFLEIFEISSIFTTFSRYFHISRYYLI